MRERSKMRLWGVYSHPAGIVKWKSRLERQVALARWTAALLTDDEVASVELAMVVGGYLKGAGRQWRMWPGHTGWPGRSGDSLD